MRKALSTRALRILTNVELAYWDDQTKALQFDFDRITSEIKSGEMLKYRDLGDKTYREIASYFGIPYTKLKSVQCPHCLGRGRIMQEIQIHPLP